jgi:kynurenine formamidase
MTATEQQRTDNWGRWGADDERGALNLVTPETVLAATQVCRTGKTYSLALPIQQQGVPLVPYRGVPQRLTLVNFADGDMYAEWGAPEVGANEDMLILASHNETHMDALCHVFDHGKLYNGFAAETMKTHSGAQRCGIDKVGCIAGRAVLLDMVEFLGPDEMTSAHNVTAAELQACADAEGVSIGPGDILLIRTGWLSRFLADPTNPQTMASQPGIGLDAVSLIRDRDVAAVGADNSAVETIPFDGQFLSVHIELLIKLGVYLLEHLVLDDLARDRVYESLLVVAPLTITGAAGSPINPIAIA